MHTYQWEISSFFFFLLETSAKVDFQAIQSPFFFFVHGRCLPVINICVFTHMSVDSVDIIRRVGRHLSCCAAQATRCRPACNIKQLCFNTEWQNTCNKGDYKGPVPDSASSPLGLQHDLPAPSWKNIAETLALTRRPDSLKGRGGQKQLRHSKRRRSAWK